MSKKPALGKGMEGLLPIGFNVGSIAEPGEKIVQVIIGHITPNKNQPRKSFDPQSLNELADSIKEHGVIQPLIITTKNDNDTHEIVAGERRWRASKIAGLKTVPAIIRDTQAQQKLEIAIIENVQRVDLTPLEEAMSIYRLKNEFSLNLQEIAKKLGKATTTISNTMRLLQLPEEAKKALMNNKITEGHARTILSLTDEKLQNTLLNKIITQNLSVRQSENEARKIKPGKATNKSIPKNNISITPIMKKELHTVSEKFGTKIDFNVTSSKLTIQIKDKAQLQNIIDTLNS